MLWSRLCPAAFLGPPLGRLLGPLLGLMMLGAAACGVGGDAGPAPIGDQRIAGHDLSNLFFWNSSTLAFTRLDSEPDPSNPSSFPRNLWVWPDGMVAPLSTATSWSNSWSVRKVGDLLLTGDHGEQEFDLASLASANLDAAGQPDTDGVLRPIRYATIRPDGGAVLAYREAHPSALLIGRGPAPTEIATTQVLGVDFLGEDLAVVASFDRGNFALSRVAVSTGQVTALGAPTFDAAGLDFGCAAGQDSACTLFRAVACGEAAAACPDGTQPRCSIFYVRSGVNPSATALLPFPFAFDVASGTESALPGEGMSDLSVSPDQRRVAWVQWLDAATAAADGTPAAELYFRDLCTGLTGHCPLAERPRLAWRSDGEVLVAHQVNGGLPVVTFSDGVGVCSDLSPGVPVGPTAFSSDHSRMAWIASTSDDDDQLWVGDGVGRSAAAVATGRMGAMAFSPDGTKVILGRTATFYFKLSWIDLGADPPPERPITELASTFQIDSDRRVMALDRWNMQDESGRLVAADLAAGTLEVLAESVTAFASTTDADGATRVAYVIHNRFPSARDGLWETTLPPP